MFGYQSLLYRHNARVPNKCQMTIGEGETLEVISSISGPTSLSLTQTYDVAEHRHLN